MEIAYPIYVVYADAHCSVKSLICGPQFAAQAFRQCKIMGVVDRPLLK